MPSPSRSPIDTTNGDEPVVKLTFVFRFTDVATNGLLSYDGRYGCGESLVKLQLVLLTVTGAKVAPVGTVTVSEVEVALFTIASVAPKKTVLLAAVVWKFVPVIVTDDAGYPISGLTDVIVGGVANVTLTVAVLLQPEVEPVTV